MEEKHAGGRPLKYKTPDELETAIDAYFKDELNTRKTLAGLAIHLDLDRKTLYNYKERDEFIHMIKKAVAKIEAMYEERMIFDGQPTGVIFALKNMGWTDKTETDLNVKGKLPDWMKDEESKL